MKRLILSLLVAVPMSAMANSELNGDGVTADHQVLKAADHSAQSVVIQFNSKGVPVAVAHSAQKLVKTTELQKLTFAQTVLAAEQHKALSDSTPASEKNDAQGTPQWGYYGTGFVYRGGYGGVIAGRGYWGGGWGGSYVPNYGYYANAGWGCGGYYGGCGVSAPVYYYQNCAYQPVGFYGYGGGYYGYYQPAYYY